MKKLCALLLALGLICALFAGCTNDLGQGSASGGQGTTPGATPSMTPSANPSMTPRPSPELTPSPSAAPEDGGLLSPSPEAQGAGLNAWNSAYGYSMHYDAALLRATETDGSESFRTVHSQQPAITVRCFRESSAEELEEQLLLQLEGAWELRTEQLGAEPYPVSALRSVMEEGEHWYYILDCGERRLLLETRLPGDGPLPGAVQEALGSFRLMGETALLQMLSDVQRNFVPDAAGSSLRAAKLAGRLLDWYSETAAEPAMLADGACRSYAASAGDAQQLRTNLEAVYAAALMLCGEEGPQLLEDSGYQPRVQPWSREDAQMLFTALLNAAREE